MTDPNKTLQVLSEGDLSVLDTLMHMTEGSFEASGSSPEAFMLVRLQHISRWTTLMVGSLLLAPLSTPQPMLAF
jgi:hypothetical protein